MPGPVRAGRKAKEAPKALETVKFRLVQDFLIDAPIYTDKYGGRGNWMARISLDAMAPGGLDRKFCSRGKGACLYVIDELQLFDAIEFAADTTSPHSSRKRTNRWYGVVVARTDGYILVERWEKAVDAVMRSQDAKTNPRDRIRALQEQLDVLVSEAAQIQSEIQDLERSLTHDVVAVEPGRDEVTRRHVQSDERAEGELHDNAGEAVVEANVAPVSDPVDDLVPGEHDISDPEAVLLGGSWVTKRD